MANEKRLIDANAFLEHWNKEYRHRFPCDMYKVAIANFPTVDAVEVVRCKDCKCGKPARNTVLADKVVNCALYDPMPIMRCDDFCSYGERREGE